MIWSNNRLKNMEIQVDYDLPKSTYTVGITIPFITFTFKYKTEEQKKYIMNLYLSNFKYVCKDENCKNLIMPILFENPVYNRREHFYVYPNYITQFAIPASAQGYDLSARLINKFINYEGAEVNLLYNGYTKKFTKNPDIDNNSIIKDLTQMVYQKNTKFEEILNFKKSAKNKQANKVMEQGLNKKESDIDQISNMHFSSINHGSYMEKYAIKIKKLYLNILKQELLQDSEKNKKSIEKIEKLQKELDLKSK